MVKPGTPMTADDKVRRLAKTGASLSDAQLENWNGLAEAPATS